MTSRHAGGYRRSLSIWGLWVGTLAVTALHFAASVASAVPGLANPRWSPDGRHLALSDDCGNGMYLYDTQTETCVRITDAPGSGYACNWSADSKKLGFKLLVPVAGSVFPLQMPVVFDVQQQKVFALHTAVPRAGVPSFSSNGLTAFTIDRDLRIVDSSGKLVKSVPLGHYANLAPVSPDGTKVAYNTADDQVAVLELATGQSTRLTSDQNGYFGPVWSPDSARLAVSTIAARLKSIDIQAKRMHDLDEGTNPSWAPDCRTIFYSRTDRIDGVQVLDSDIYHIQSDGSGKTRLAAGDGHRKASARLSPDGRNIAFVSLTDGRLYRAPLTKATSDGGRTGETTTYSTGQLIGLAKEALSATTSSADTLTAFVQTGSSASPPIEAATSVSLLRPIPYVHQVYDTPDAFDGNWACGATSAIMAINYYGILPYWDVTCSTPYSHVSHYGRYVSDIYTYNGVTYNIRAKDASGQWAYGGYAYIVRNNWADTKGYMRDYIINHGLSSAVDWSPTWEKLQTEVNNDDPCVVLNSLTSAGHYITTIGYYTTQRTAVFNDPYGNKNTPGYPSYDGAGALYDWPGYNNGFQNLNTVHCFIYCRGGLPPLITGQPAGQIVEWRSNTSLAVTAVGEGALGYQWQKNGTDLTNSGRYSGAQSTTLTIAYATEQESGDYRCLVSNAFGETVSNSATLTVLPPPAPPGDMDRDGDVDQKDFGLFQACISGGLTPQGDPACADARLDNDSDVDQMDVGLFLGCVSGPQVPASFECLAP